ncbi:MAG: PEGA domain-containing protein, partial [Acidobacteriota bacterium]|nr:PEGA domain-containing protein [Acidobacteriota bacterium]
MALDTPHLDDDNLWFMLRRPVFLTLCASVLLVSSLAAAQGASGLVVLRVVTPSGAVASGALAELSPLSVMALARSARVGDTSVAWSVPPADYRLRITLAGYGNVERIVSVAPGVLTTVDIRLAPETTSAEGIVAEDRADLARQTAFGGRMLDGLPSAGTLPSLVETAHPFLVTDRIDGGGLWTGEIARIGGAGSSALQTTYRLDGLDVTDPLFTGTPLFYPDLGVLRDVSVESAYSDPASAGPGPTVTMVLRRPGDRWTGTAGLQAAPRAWASDPGDIAPIARLESWIDGSITAGGPLTNNVGVFAAGRVTDGQRVEREQPGTLDSTVRSFTTHLVAQAKPGQQVRAVASFADINRPLSTRARFADRDLDQHDRQAVVSATWEVARDGGTWSVGAAYQRGSSDGDVSPTALGGRIERLRDGPPLALVDPTDTRRQRWDVRAGFEPSTRRWLGRDHAVQVGAGLGGASAASTPGPQAP